MATRVTHDEKTKQLAEKLYRDGMGYVKVGQALDVSPSTVRRWIVEASRDGRLAIHGGSTYDDEYRQGAVDYYEANERLSISECAYIHGVAATTMSRWLRKAGVPAKSSEDKREFDHGEIAERIEAGEVGAHIAESMGCSEALVSKIRRQIKEAAKKQYDHKAIKADLKSGMTGAAVAQKHGCSPSLVSFLRSKGKK